MIAQAGALQQAIDRVEPGAMIELGSGVIEESVTIDKPLTLKGVEGKTLLQGPGRGTVVTIGSSHVHLEGLTIQGSGRRRERLDAAVKMDGVSDVSIKGCKIEKSLFGIIAERSAHLEFSRNSIRSYPEKVVDNRGDFIRLWGSHDIKVRGNRLEHGRDLSVTRSHNVLLADNRIREARYGILASMDTNLTARGNDIRNIYAGFFIRGGRDLNATGNTVFDTRTATGTGILLAHGRNIHISDNLLMACAQALYIDASPVEIGMRRYIYHNAVVDNVTALHFHAALRNNTIRDNDFVGNLHDVERDIPKAKREHNDIALNYWDRYEGFDRDRDGVGDTPYRVLIYADKLWQDDHRLKFFYATPILSLVDFIERLAPFDAPEELLKDPRPRMQRNIHSTAIEVK
ncbi:nitrous oxide reductase family maturation protein NosD [Nitratifractor salsuginis]|uniref:nitrous oxide reductase family maturation protein NosD n=1 Tax=Nitratifractor salsuginis TaxID=269261 RepID=UPI001CB7194B|nr:nitrous oxide reductase family maturation protein NosD [Nitratifractor salsuginis]